MNTYTAGQVLVCTATFTVSGVNTDPTTVEFKYALSTSGSTVNGTTTTLTYSGATQPALGVVAKTATGVYEAQVDTTGMGAGDLTYEWVSTGAAQTVGSSVVQIAAQAL